MDSVQAQEYFGADVLTAISVLFSGIGSAVSTAAEAAKDIFIEAPLKAL